MPGHFLNDSILHKDVYMCAYLYAFIYLPNKHDASM